MSRTSSSCASIQCISSKEYCQTNDRSMDGWMDERMDGSIDSIAR
jgi:hypothetical protein